MACGTFPKASLPRACNFGCGAARHHAGVHIWEIFFTRRRAPLFTHCGGMAFYLYVLYNSLPHTLRAAPLCWRSPLYFIAYGR